MSMQTDTISKIQSFGRSIGRAFIPLYHADTVNHCPACGHTHWHIGRSTAECAFCETALPLSAVAAQPNAPLFWNRSARGVEALGS